MQKQYLGRMKMNKKDRVNTIFLSTGGLVLLEVLLFGTQDKCEQDV